MHKYCRHFVKGLISDLECEMEEKSSNQKGRIQITLKATVNFDNREGIPHANKKDNKNNKNKKGRQWNLLNDQKRIYRPTISQATKRQNIRQLYACSGLMLRH